MKAEIVKWQLKFYASSEMNLPLYKDFLNKYNEQNIIKQNALEDIFITNENNYDKKESNVFCG